MNVMFRIRLLAGSSVAVFGTFHHTQSKTAPGVIEAPRSKEALYFQSLLGERTIFLSGSITEDSAKNVVAQLLYLEMARPGVPIKMYICSGGGQVYPGLSILDVMEYITSPVHTICVGHAESMAAILVAAGAPGHRQSMPHSRFMLHEPSVGLGRSTTTDLLIQAKEFEQTRDRLVQVISKHTRRDSHAVIAEIERNHYMSPAEAITFGVIDTIITKRLVKESFGETKLPTEPKEQRVEK